MLAKVGWGVRKGLLRARAALRSSCWAAAPRVCWAPGGRSLQPQLRRALRGRRAAGRAAIKRTSKG